jgi:hypothetical protein
MRSTIRASPICRSAVGRDSGGSPRPRHTTFHSRSKPSGLCACVSHPRYVAGRETGTGGARRRGRPPRPGRPCTPPRGPRRAPRPCTCTPAAAGSAPRAGRRTRPRAPCLSAPPSAAPRACQSSRAPLCACVSRRSRVCVQKENARAGIGMCACRRRARARDAPAVVRLAERRVRARGGRGGRCGRRRRRLATGLGVEGSEEARVVARADRVGAGHDQNARRGAAHPGDGRRVV